MRSTFWCMLVNYFRGFRNYFPGYFVWTIHTTYIKASCIFTAKLWFTIKFLPSFMRSTFWCMLVKYFRGFRNYFPGYFVWTIHTTYIKASCIVTAKLSFTIKFLPSFMRSTFWCMLVKYFRGFRNYFPGYFVLTIYTTYIKASCIVTAKLWFTIKFLPSFMRSTFWCMLVKYFRGFRNYFPGILFEIFIYKIRQIRMWQTQPYSLVSMLNISASLCHPQGIHISNLKLGKNKIDYIRNI